MGKLILVKHSQPVLDPDVPSPRWVLSDEGARRCVWLADTLKAHGVTRLCSSLEPKALETAAQVAVRLGLCVEPHDGLQENDRTGQGFVEEDELRRSIARFFDEPDQLVMGAETAEAALARYAEALRAVLAGNPGGDVAVITHGTVLTLFVSRHNPVDAFGFWSGLTTPSVVMLDRETFALAGPPQNFPKGS